jgi:hypothetical protein
VQEWLAAGELETVQTQWFGFADGRLKGIDRQVGIAVAFGIELGRDPAVTAGQVAAFGQVKVELAQRIVWRCDSSPPGSENSAAQPSTSLRRMTWGWAIGVSVGFTDEVPARHRSSQPRNYRPSRSRRCQSCKSPGAAGSRRCTPRDHVHRAEAPRHMCSLAPHRLSRTGNRSTSRFQLPRCNTPGATGRWPGTLHLGPLRLVSGNA